MEYITLQSLVVILDWLTFVQKQIESLHKNYVGSFQGKSSFKLVWVALPKFICCKYVLLGIVSFSRIKILNLMK